MTRDWQDEHVRDPIDRADWLDDATVRDSEGYEVFIKPADEYPDEIRSRVPRPVGVRRHTERGPAL